MKERERECEGEKVSEEMFVLENGGERGEKSWLEVSLKNVSQIGVE